ncbi:Glycosyltransferase AglG [uncultured archaeon]|nr:Glycosyltransferase AglG [uncultured archaeon]
MEVISIVISTYDDPINFVSQCLNSLLHQKRVDEIIVVDSSKKDDIKSLCHSLGSDKINYIYTPPKGLSDARNKGINIARNDIIAFTDADCIVDKNWAENIYISFDERKNNEDMVAIVGGKVLPKWISKPNRILYYSSIAQGFYSLFDMGDKLKEVDQIFGANFAIDRNLITGYFSKDLGRKKENLLCGEETKLCKQTKENKLKIIYNPLAIVWHQIPEERSKFKWIWKRIYYGGISRALVGGKPTPKTVDSFSYNLYDGIFLAIFIIPYTYGFLKARFENGKFFRREGNV